MHCGFIYIDHGPQFLCMYSDSKKENVSMIRKFVDHAWSNPIEW